MLRPDWDAIAGRIAGLEAATRLYFPGVEARGSDYYGVSNSDVIPMARDIFRDIQRFRTRYASQIPPAARTTLDDFSAKHRDQFEKANGIPGVGLVAVALVSLSATVSAELADQEFRARSITERAFAHLQRLIVADPATRATWRAASAQGEIECERLGACHLLLHGIWAFKISASGERTDLVYGEPLEVGEAERASPSALVLTEWKLAPRDADADAKFDEARRQAKLYALGSMSDIELTSTRYLIVVTQQRRESPPDLREGDILYRHIAVAVDPPAPSVAAHRKSASSPSPTP